MGMSGQLYVAQTEGSQHTLYATMRMMGIPLSPEQERRQAYLESQYPPCLDPDCPHNKKEVS